MKTASFTVELIGVFCPECREAFYDKNGQDWSPSSVEGSGASRFVGKIVTCDTCATRFRLPGILGRIGRRS